MREVILKFEFNENNFNTEKTRFQSLLEKCKNENINIQYSKNFPPCVYTNTNDSTMDMRESKTIKYSPHDIIEEKQIIKLDNKNIVLNSNIYFGEKYKNINRMFSKSPFISDKCKMCKLNTNSLCRGMPNSDFQKVKSNLTLRLREDVYTAIQGDFENSMFTYGSRCSNSCKFCLDRFMPDDILRYSPDLRVQDIAHFLHYLPDFLCLIGCGFHCKSGEVLHSPHFEEIFDKIIQKFLVVDPYMFITSGDRLSTKRLDQIKNSEIRDTIQIGLSVNALDTEYRRRFNLPEINYTNLIHEIKKRDINYHVSVMPLKSIVESGKIFETFDKVFEIDPEAQIRIQPANPSQFMDQTITDEFYFDKEKLKEEIRTQYPNKNFLIVEELVFANLDLIKKAVSTVKEITTNGENNLILCPGKTYSHFKDLETSTTHVKKVKSGLGFKDEIVTGILRVDEYITAIQTETIHYDNVIIPRNSFTMNFEDFTLASINEIWEKLEKINSKIILT